MSIEIVPFEYNFKYNDHGEGTSHQTYSTDPVDRAEFSPDTNIEVNTGKSLYLVHA